jgi:hypothetical protein
MRTEEIIWRISAANMTLQLYKIKKQTHLLLAEFALSFVFFSFSGQRNQDNQK